MMNYKILFITPPGKYPEEFPPLNIMLLQAYLKKRGLKSDCYDFSMKIWEKMIKDREFFKKFYYLFCQALKNENSNMLKRDMFLFYLNKQFKKVLRNFGKKDAIDDTFYFYRLFTHIPLSASPKPDNSFISWIAGEEKLLYALNVMENLALPPLKDLKEDVEKKIEDCSIVCISITYVQQLKFLFPFTLHVKTINPNIKIVVGGKFITSIKEFKGTLTPEYFEYIDYIITNEGEESLFKLVKSLNQHKSVKKIPNLHYMSNGRVISNKESFIKNLESLPIQDYKAFSSVMNENKHLDLLTYEIGRGCYWGKCAFCQKFRTKLPYREKSAKKIAKELALIKKSTGKINFHLINDVSHPEKVLAMSEELIKKSVNVKWKLMMRFERSINKDFLQILKKAGCFQIHFGLETGNQESCDFLEKGIKIKDAERIIRLCTEVGIKPIVSVILGLPNESPYQMFKTIKFFYKNKQFINYFGFNQFRLFALTKIHLNPQKYGISSIENIEKNRLKFKKHNFYQKYLIKNVIYLSDFYFNNLRNKNEAVVC